LKNPRITLRFRKKEEKMIGGVPGTATGAPVASALKAMGGVVYLGPDEFMRILEKEKEPIVVTSESRLFGITYHYLTSRRGFIFYTRSKQPLHLPGEAEVIKAKTIWIPQM